MDRSDDSMDLETENSPRRIKIYQDLYSDKTYAEILDCDDNVATVFAELLTNRNLRVSSSSEDIIDGSVVVEYILTDLKGRKLSREACTELKSSLQKLFPRAVIYLRLPRQTTSDLWNDLQNSVLPTTPLQIQHNGLKDKLIKIIVDEMMKKMNNDEEMPMVHVEEPVTEMNLTDKLKQCAHAVASRELYKSYKLLCEIRCYSSPEGNASKKLAYCFASGLEARMSGDWNSIYQKNFTGEISHSDILNSYAAYYEKCPIQKASHFLSNKTIIDQIKDAKTVHIIDLGVGFGLQWPKLMEHLSKRVGGPPKLLITGEDMPLPGMYPTNQMNYAKKLLEHFAKTFNVPFEYKGIESKWEDVTVKSLNIDRDEVLIVNCLSHSGYISGDTLAMHGLSDPVLELIQELKPAAIIHGRAAVFSEDSSFLWCIEEALLHYSALFDMIDENIPTDEKDKLLVEIFGREILNIMAYRGPETKGKWEQRCMNQHLVQCDFNHDVLKKFQDSVKPAYKNNFVIKAENKNVLMEWKGRTVFTMSVWRPSQ